MKKKTANQLLIKPAIKLSAQYTTPCAFRTQPLEQRFADCEAIFARNDISFVDKACIEMSIYGGMRISSILQFSYKHVLSDLRCCVPQCKGSSNIIYIPVFTRSFVFNVRKYKLTPFEGMSRFYYYRLFKKLGLSEKFGTNNNFSVTHIGRHLQGINHRCLDSNNFDKSQVLGHKNAKNITHYEKDIRKEK
jgi:hypothetical protein